MEKKKSEAESNPFRVRFPDDEARNVWLPMLLDAYEVIDRGIYLAIQREKRKNQRRPACSSGCGNCCSTHADIPLYPLEMVGLYWYILEKTAPGLRRDIMGRLAGTSGSSSMAACPFLSENRCMVYPLRPAACRQFIVFGRPCSAGEDPYHTRRNDVLTPLQDFIDRAFYIMLPFYGITGDADKASAIKNRIIHSRVKNLKTTDWKPLVQRISESLQQDKEL